MTSWSCIMKSSSLIGHAGSISRHLSIPLFSHHWVSMKISTRSLFIWTSAGPGHPLSGKNTFSFFIWRSTNSAFFSMASGPLIPLSSHSRFPGIKNTFPLNSFRIVVSLPAISPATAVSRTVASLLITLLGIKSPNRITELLSWVCPIISNIRFNAG